MQPVVKSKIEVTKKYEKVDKMIDRYIPKFKYQLVKLLKSIYPRVNFNKKRRKELYVILFKIIIGKEK